MSEYSHVAATVFDKPWMLEPDTLRVVAGVVRDRLAGAIATEVEIAARIRAASAQHGPRQARGTISAVAVIPIFGVLMPRATLMTDISGGTTVAALREAFRIAMADRAVGAIVFEVDSPGGAVDQIEELATEIRTARGSGKSIVAVVNTMCASAAYYLASQADEIVASPSSIVGSIGVYVVHEEESRANDKAGYTVTIIRQPAEKNGANQFEPLTETARQNMQQRVDDYYGQFVAAVAAGRRVPRAKVTSDFGGGLLMTATRAKAAGLVDRVDTLDATIRRLASAWVTGSSKSAGQLTAGERVAATALALAKAKASKGRRY